MPLRLLIWLTTIFSLISGNSLQFNLSDMLDIYSKSMSFISEANTVLFLFKCTDPLTKMKLFQSYCFSLYGSCLWRLACEELNSLSASFNNIIRRIWNLPRIGRTSIVHSVGSVVGIHNIIIGLVVCVLLPCSTLHLLFVPFLLTVLVPVIQTLLVTALCMATAVKVGVPKLGNCLEMYTCAQACAQACIQLQCTRGGQAVAPVYKECPSLYTSCAQIRHWLGHVY